MMSVETQNSIIKDIQGFTGDDLKKYLKALVDEVIYSGIDKDFMFQDIKDGLDIITDTTPDKYHSLDTAARDHFIDAYLKMHL